MEVRVPAGMDHSSGTSLSDTLLQWMEWVGLGVGSQTANRPLDQ